MTAVEPDEAIGDSDGNAVPASSSTDGSPLVIPPRKKRGICRVCGEPANAPRGSYCDEHAHLAGSPGRPAKDPQPEPRDKRPPREPPSSSGKRVDGGRPSELETQLRTMLVMAAQVWMVRDPTCGGALMNAAPSIAEYWANQARNSDRVRRALESLTSSGGILGAIAVHLPVLVAVFGHHIAPAIAAQQAPPIIVEEFVDPVDAFAQPSTNGHGPDPQHPDPFGWDTPQPDAAFTHPDDAAPWPDAPQL